MKVLLSFLTMTVIGGLLVLVPMALLVFVLGDVLAMVVELVAPIADLLPVESLGGGFSTVMIPSVPAALAGPLQYVRNERLRRLEVPLARVVQSLQGCGIGAGPLFAPDTSALPAAS